MARNIPQRHAFSASKTISISRANVDMTPEQIARACQTFGYHLDSIDDADVISVCEGCSKPITEDADCHGDGEGVDLCTKCWNECIADYNKRTAGKEQGHGA